MFIVPGQSGRDLCDRHLGMTRRDIMRIGGSGMLGLSLDTMFRLQAASAKEASSGLTGTAGWNKAKSVIMVYLQGGPSHLDLWDPKDNVPDNVRSVFKPIATKLPGVNFTEVLPKLAAVNDKFTMIRSMSYTPNGLFNHTAAIYQMMTGYTTDKVSPSGQLEPPSPKDFPNFGSNIIRLKPPTEPMLPFVMLPRPLQESNVVGKGGAAGFLGKAYDPYTLYPDGDDMDQKKMDRIKVDDLQLRPEVFAMRLQRRARLRDAFNAGMKDMDKAVADYNLDEYYARALNLIVSGRARDAFDLERESPLTRDRYGRTTFGQSLLLARRLVEAGTRVVEVIWPKVANSDNHSWDHHVGLTERMKDRSGPMLDAGLSALIADLDERGMLDETLVIAVGEFGRSPQKGVSTSGNGNSADGRDHWPYCYTACIAGAGIKRGQVHGKSDKTGSAPVENPVHPAELLATIYHAVGIDPATIVYNHLNQPRELVKAEIVPKIVRLTGGDQAMARIVRLAAVSFTPPAHDHHRLGVNLDAIREVVLRVAQEKPDFLCFPEVCACIGGGLARGVESAPDLEPFADAVGKLAREVGIALVVPFLERYMGQVYNSVPIVDRAGKLALIYRKNYPTTGEMDAGITPGWEVPVAECDGVRVGAAVCFDANFPQVAAELERNRARLVFWPSMFWGGEFLQHWALRYGFTIVVAFGPESAVIDMGGRYLVKQGTDTPQVRGGRLPPWAVADVNVDREVFHLDFNQAKFPALREKYGPDLEIDVRQPEAVFLLASRRPDLTVERVAEEFQLETLRAYLARSVRQREEHLRGHPHAG